MQVVILAEDENIRNKLAEHDIIVQTIADVAPIEVQPARVLSHLYTYLGIAWKGVPRICINNKKSLGRNRKLGLSGRKSRDVGILSTSKLYAMGDKIFAFTPQVKKTAFFRYFFVWIIFLTLVYRHVTKLYSVWLWADDRYLQERDKFPEIELAEHAGPPFGGDSLPRCTPRYFLSLFLCFYCLSISFGKRFNNGFKRY